MVLLAPVVNVPLRILDCGFSWMVGTRGVAGERFTMADCRLRHRGRAVFLETSCSMAMR